LSCRELALSGSEVCRGPAFIAPALTEGSVRQGVPVDGRALAGHDEAVLTVPCPGLSPICLGRRSRLQKL